MNNIEDKPKKPKWFWIVEAIISLGLIYLIYTALVVVTKVFISLGVLPVVSLVFALTLLGMLVHGVILPNWKVGE